MRFDSRNGVRDAWKKSRVSAVEDREVAMSAIKTENVKLVTIITPYAFEERIANELLQLGATGFSSSKVDGHGAHGPRKFGFADGENIRLEVLVHDDATKILHNLAARYAADAVVAYAIDAVAVPTGHFG